MIEPDALIAALDTNHSEPGTNDDPALVAALAMTERIEGLFALLRRPPSVEVDDEIKPGTSIDGFEVIRQLGEGGFARVYLARQLALNRFVALKVFRAEHGTTPARARFQAEARTLAKFHHRSVVPVITAGEDSGRLFLAMEFLPGASLAEALHALRNSAPMLASNVLTRIARSRLEFHNTWGKAATLDRAYWVEVSRLLRMVASGLAEMHKSGIVHRDLKPSNVILAKDGVPTIVDFGLARVEGDERVTVSHAFVGTPAYASPEQALGQTAEIGPQSDVFSFGAIFFEFLSLQRPFDGDTPLELLDAVARTAQRPLRAIRRQVPWELEAIVDKCLQKSKASRYRDGNALLMDIDAFLESRPISATRITRVHRMARACRRRPMVVVAAILAVCLLLATTVIGLKSHAEQVERQRIARNDRYEALMNAGEENLFACLHTPSAGWLPETTSQQRSDAISSFDAAIEIKPNEVAPRIRRAELRLSTGTKADLENARDDLLHASKVAPGFASVRKILSITYGKLGDADAAARLASESAELYPTDALDLYFLGHAIGSMEQRHEEAYKLFTQCLALEPDNYWARLERVLFGEQIGVDFETNRKFRLEELASLDRQSVRRPFAREYLIRFSQLGSVVDESDVTRAKSLIQDFGLTVVRAHKLADYQMARQEYSEAISTLKQVVEQDSGGVTSEKLAECAELMEDADGAERWYRDAIAKKCHRDNAWLGLADVLGAAGRIVDAEQVYRESIDAFSDRARPRNAYAEWLRTQHREHDEEQSLQEILRLPATYTLLGRALDQRFEIEHAAAVLAELMWERGKHAEAIQLLEGVIEQNPEASSEAWSTLIDLHLRNGNSASVQRILNRARDNYLKEPASMPRLMILGNVAERGHKQVPTLARAVSYGASFARNTHEREQMERIAGRLDPALAASSLDVWMKFRMDGNLTDYEYVRLATETSKIAPLLNLDEEAILQAGLQRFPNSDELWSLRALVHLRNGKTEEADKAFQKAKSIHLKKLGEPKRTSELLFHVNLNEIQSVTQRLLEFLLRRNKVEECDRFAVEVEALYRKQKWEPKQVNRYRALAAFSAERWQEALTLLDAARDDGILSVAEAIPRTFQCYDKLHDTVGMAATTGAYCRLPEPAPTILALMIWRLQLVGDEFCREKLAESLPFIPADRVLTDPELRATVDGFWACMYCTPLAKEKGITDEQRKLVVERAIKSIETALDSNPEHSSCPLWAAELHAALKFLDDPRAADWESILAKCPPEEIARAKHALPPYSAEKQ